MQVESSDVWTFVIGFFYLPLLFSRSIHVVVCITASLLLMAD